MVLGLKASEIRAMHNALPVLKGIAALTTGCDDLTDAHLQSDSAATSLAALIGMIELDATGGHRAVGDRAGEELAAQRTGGDHASE